MRTLEKIFARYRVTENPLKALRRLELTALILAVLFLLWATLGGLATALGGGPKPLLPSEDTLKVRALGLEQPLDEDASDHLIARPLFWEGRRAIDITPAEVMVSNPEPAQPKKLEGVTLHGVYGAGESLGVIATVDGELTRVNARGAIKGWKISSFEEGEVIFERGGRKQRLPLELTTPTVRVAAAPKPTASNPSEEPRQREPVAGSDGADEQQAEELIQRGGLGFGGSNAPRGRGNNSRFRKKD